MDLAVLCDFDGTIVEIDTAVFVLDKFSHRDWRAFGKQYDRGQITLEDCLRKQFSMVMATREEILNELDRVVNFRPNFERLIRYCWKKSIPFVIVSAGLDFVINHFLRQKRWEELVETFMPKTKFGANGVSFIFPRLLDKTSVNFKQDLVRNFRAQGKKVIYIGDGTADYPAAISADYRFAVKGSRLAELFENHRAGCVAIRDFMRVTETIRKITT